MERMQKIKMEPKLARAWRKNAGGFQQNNRRISWERPSPLLRQMFLGRALGVVTAAVMTLFLRAGLFLLEASVLLPIWMLQASRD